MSSRIPLALLLLLAGGCATSTRLGPADDRAFEVSAAWVGGHPAVAWYGGRLAHEAIFLQPADLRGRPNGPPLQLTDASRDAFEPSLQDLRGDALLAWYEQESVPGGAPRQWALLARFDASGRRLWQRRLSSDDAQGRIPVVRVAGEIIHVAWLEQRGDALPRLRVASLDEAGAVRVEARDAALAGRETWNLNAAVGADGSFHVLFDAAQAGEPELHWVRVQDDRIQSLVVSRKDGRRSAYPDVAFQGNRFAVAWLDSRDGKDEVYLRCGELDAGGVVPQGLLLDEAARRVTHAPGESSGAYLAWNAGHLELAWTEVQGRHRVLRRQRFDADCSPLEPARFVPGRGTEAGIPSLATAPAGFLLAWNGQHRGSSVVWLQVEPGRLSPNAAAR